MVRGSLHKILPPSLILPSNFVGSLGSSILNGILSSSSQISRPTPGEGSAPGKSNLAPETITACVHTRETATRLKQKYARHPNVQVFANENVRGVNQSNIIILAVEPRAYHSVLAEPGMRSALAGKTLISIVGGLSLKVLQQTIYGEEPSTAQEKNDHCRIVRVLPNTATAIHEGMTLIIEEDEYKYTTETLELVCSLFGALGQARLWPAAKLPIGATLSACSPAFFTYLLEAFVDTGVGLGLDREEALEMATAGMRGAAGLLASGEDSREVKRKIATKGGSTEAGLKALEEGNTRKAVEKAVKACALVAGGLGD